MASATSKVSWMIAVTVGAAEALKDQGGACGWNAGFRTLHRHAKANWGGLSQTLRRHPLIADGRSDGRAKASEESLRRVMYLSCWGPN